MKKVTSLLLLLVMVAAANAATNAVSLGYSDQGTTIGAGQDACADGVLYYNHDGSFENGYAWRYGGTVPPYYGSFGEGIGGLGARVVWCAAFWVSTLPGMFFGQSADCYVWSGGTSGAPGGVVGMVSGVVFSDVPSWPTCHENDVTMHIGVTGDFTVGYWGNWPGAPNGYFCAADLNGFGGHPWTYVAPGIGYPTGWNNPSIFWGPTQSMGCGAWVSD